MLTMKPAMVMTLALRTLPLLIISAINANADKDEACQESQSQLFFHKNNACEHPKNRGEKGKDGELGHRVNMDKFEPCKI